MLSRRGFIFLTGAVFVGACGGPKVPGPAIIDLTIAGGPGMNEGPDGADRPVTISVLRLRDVGAFNTADVFALQADPAAALGGDFVGMEQLVVAPGGTATANLTVPPDVPHVGLIAMLRNPTGRVWRLVLPIAPESTTTATVELGPEGMVLATV